MTGDVPARSSSVRGTQSQRVFHCAGGRGGSCMCVCLAAHARLDGCGAGLKDSDLHTISLPCLCATKQPHMSGFCVIHTQWCSSVPASPGCLAVFLFVCTFLVHLPSRSNSDLHTHTHTVLLGSDFINWKSQLGASASSDWARQWVYFFLFWREKGQKGDSRAGVGMLDVM